MLTQPDSVPVAMRPHQCTVRPYKNSSSHLNKAQGAKSHSTGILYDGSQGVGLVGYADSDYAGDTKKRKSTSGYVFMMANGAISWKSKKQSVVATSSCEAEYIASCLATKEAVWLARLVQDLSCKPKNFAVPIKVDNNGAKDLAYNATVNERTKHIDIQYHFVRECALNKKIELQRCDTADQVADPLTKPLDRQQHRKLCNRQGLQEAGSL